MAKILIADSCDLGRRYVREVLQFDGHHVLEAADFEDMVASLLVTRVDALLLDPTLQGTTPGSLERFLRRRSPDGPRAFLLATADAGKLRAMATRLGADGAFVKGDDAVSLLRVVERATERTVGIEGEDSLARQTDADADIAPPDHWPPTCPPRRPWDRTGNL